MNNTEGSKVSEPNTNLRILDIEYDTGRKAGLRKGKKVREALRARVRELEAALKPFATFEPHNGSPIIHGKYAPLRCIQFELARKILEKGSGS